MIPPRLLALLVTSFVGFVLVACGADEAAGALEAGDVAALGDALTDSALPDGAAAWPDAWSAVPACSEALAHFGPGLGLEIAPGTPPDNACPAWWPAGPARVDGVGAAELRLTFLPDGPAVTATFDDAPDLRDAAFAVGDTVDAVAFVERCEIIFNSALALWRPDGTPLLYAEQDSGFSNSTEWRAACDAVHPCPSAELDATLGGGCRLPDDECSTGNRLLPVAVALAPGAVLSVDLGPAHALTAGDATWQAVARGWSAVARDTCMDFFGHGLTVVAVRAP
jgi:hypothetical protein